eukprot:TRINITY_DN23363_c0_g1_i1.p1 TRINITY_DN23363_c0_g1~~TRINITY_DN23363_c0_g1_i1.p1  ORF type:complete len:226 (+),score=61.13 TRINITY_DN23363_c0_g1_i1:18-695(+)
MIHRHRSLQVMPADVMSSFLVSFYSSFYFLYTHPYTFFFFLMIRRPPRSTLSSSSAASDVYKRQVCDALKNYGLATGTPHQYLTSHQVGQGFREVAIELETMADHQEHMGVQVDHAYHRLVDQACRSVEGCSRVYKARQSALQLRDHHEVSKLELGECAQNLETFEAALPHEIEYSQGRFLHDGESLVRELPGIRKQAILKELAQWEHIEKIMCEMQDSTATPSK